MNGWWTADLCGDNEFAERVFCRRTVSDFPFVFAKNMPAVKRLAVPKRSPIFSAA